MRAERAACLIVSTDNAAGSWEAGRRAVKYSIKNTDLVALQTTKSPVRTLWGLFALLTVLAPSKQQP